MAAIRLKLRTGEAREKTEVGLTGVGQDLGKVQQDLRQTITVPQRKLSEHWGSNEYQAITLTLAGLKGKLNHFKK